MKHPYLKVACLTAGFLTAVVLPSSLRAQDPGTPPPPPPAGKEGRPELTPEQRDAMRQKRADEMATKLGLSDDQKAKMKEIEDAQRGKMKALKDDTSLTEDQKKEKMKEIWNEGKEARDAILTDDQKAKLAEMKKDHPGGPGGPGGGFGGGHHGDKGGDKPTPPAAPPAVPTPSS